MCLRGIEDTTASSLLFMRSVLERSANAAVWPVDTIRLEAVASWDCNIGSGGATQLFSLGLPSG
jgi:hypothetical protein